MSFEPNRSRDYPALAEITRLDRNAMRRLKRKLASRGYWYRRRHDLDGVRFGRLTVLHRWSGSAHSSDPTKWLCRCDCGNETVVIRPNLITGNTRSCGCLAQELRRRKP